MSIKNLSICPALRQKSAISRMALRLGASVLLMTAMVVPALAQPAVAKAAQAAEQKKVAVVLTQSKVVKAADGTEQLLDASTVKPGEVIEYKVTYTNDTGKTVTGLIANLPIPEGLEYVPKSAKPGATLVKVAAKDGVFAAEPLTHMVSGKTVPVAYEDYRSLRWTLGRLPANGVTVVSARAKVQVVVPPEPKTSAAAAQAPPVGVRPAVSATSR